MADSYGKRPFWQWVVIYIIVGGIIYGAIYYFVFNKPGGGYGSSANPYSQTQSPYGN